MSEETSNLKTVSLHARRPVWQTAVGGKFIRFAHLIIGRHIHTAPLARVFHCQPINTHTDRGYL